MSMKQNKIRIIVDYQYDKPLTLGTLIAGSCYTKKVANNIVNEAWDKFQESEPDSDDSFIPEFLKTHPNFSLVEDDAKDLILT